MEQEYNIENLLKNIRRLRKERNLTQYDMARLLHIHQTAYNGLEKGRRKIKAVHLFEIAQVFGINILELYTYPHKVRGAELETPLSDGGFLRVMGHLYQMTENDMKILKRVYYQREEE